MSVFWNGSLQTMTRYYYAGGVRAAVRHSNGTGTNGLVYLFGDHPSLRSGQVLGSASITADPVDGDKLSELRYKALRRRSGLALRGDPPYPDQGPHRPVLYQAGLLAG